MVIVEIIRMLNRTMKFEQCSICCNLDSLDFLGIEFGYEHELPLQKSRIFTWYRLLQFLLCENRLKRYKEGLEITSVADAGGAITFAAKEAGEDDPDLEGVKQLADVLGWYGKLGWELAGFEKVGRGGGAFDGA
jgi:hypothetical protein